VRRDLDEATAMAIALDYHPEWREQYMAGTLPEEIPRPDGKPLRPVLHLELHMFVERQFSADVLREVVQIAEQLAELGLSDLELRHEIESVFMRHIVSVTLDSIHRKQEPVFDPQAYLTELR